MRLTILLCILLIIGHLLTESGTIVWELNHRKQAYVNPFLSPYYKWHDAKGIDLYWWIKYVFDDVLWCTVFFVLAKVSYQYSFRLFLVGCIWFAYHVFDLAMLWWNFKTSYWLYWVIYGTVILCLFSLFVPEKKQAIVKSIN